MSALSLASTVILTGVVVCGVAKAQSTPDPSASDRMAYWSVQRSGANYGPVRLRPADLQAAANAGIDFLRLRDSLRSTSRDFLIGDADRYQGISERDLQLLRAFLDGAHGRGLKIVLTMFSLPGFRGEGAWTGLDYEIPLDARIAHLWDAENVEKIWSR